MTKDSNLEAKALEACEVCCQRGGISHYPGTEAEFASLGQGYSSIEKVLDGWYGECSAYNSYYGKEPNFNNFGEYGHFTHMVWKNGKKAGLAMKTCSNGMKVQALKTDTFNVIGQFANNVLQPKNGQCKATGSNRYCVISHKKFSKYSTLYNFDIGGKLIVIDHGYFRIKDLDLKYSIYWESLICQNSKTY